MLTFYNESVNALEKGVDVSDILKLDVRERIARAKYVREDEIGAYIDETTAQLTKDLDELIREEVSA